MSNINITIEYPNNTPEELQARLQFLRDLTGSHSELSENTDFMSRLAQAEKSAENLVS